VAGELIVKTKADQTYLLMVLHPRFPCTIIQWSWTRGSEAANRWSATARARPRGPRAGTPCRNPSSASEKLPGVHDAAVRTVPGSDNGARP
jgi:hypothetical protein